MNKNIFQYDLIMQFKWQLKFRIVYAELVTLWQMHNT